MVETIDLSFDEGTLKYVGFEKANEGLTEADNALVSKFDFTNNQAKPSQSQSVFRIQFFQNGAELKNHPSHSGKGGELYKLANAYFSDAMKGGTVSFGMIVLPKDDNPITIMASRNGGGTFYFEDGEMTVSSQGMILVGPYEVNLENTCIDAHFKSNDGQVSTIHLPYKFDDDGNLILMNNHGGEIKKK